MVRVGGSQHSSQRLKKMIIMVMMTQATHDGKNDSSGLKFISLALFVRSGLEQEDMRIMFKYLVTSLFPSTVDSEVRLDPEITTIPPPRI